MKGLRSFLTPVLMTCIAGCSLWSDGEVRQYDTWRAFHAAVSGLDSPARLRLYEDLTAQGDDTPDSLTRLKLAYLLSTDEAVRAHATDQSRIDALLSGIDDEDELAPLRDLIQQNRALQVLQEQEGARLDELELQCQALDARFSETRDARETLQLGLDTCREQLDSLKEIESMMSTPDSGLKGQR